MRGLRRSRAWRAALVALALVAAGEGRTEKAAAEVVVECATRLGDAASIGAFLGAGGALEEAMSDPAHPVTTAWTGLGFRHVTFEQLHNEEPKHRWLTVSRSAAGRVQIDFSIFDRHVQHIVKNLKARPFVYIGNVPRALSSRPDDPHFAVYAPRDLGEWKDFARRIAERLVRTHGLAGLRYHCLGEPDHLESWKGDGSADASRRVASHVALYAATRAGVKEADPTAHCGGPATMNWQRTRWTQDAEFVLEDWIAALARHNAALPPRERAGLDFVSWQDYAWSSDRISDGAEAVSKMLARHGFDAATPKVLGGSGWGSWSSDYLDEEVKPHRRASHLVHNVVREFKDPRERRFALALYYSFFFDDANLAGAMTPSQHYELSQVRRVSVLRRRWDEPMHRTPVCAAFQMLAAMTPGTIVKTSAPPPLEAMAVHDREEGTVKAIVNNHTPEALAATVVFRDLPFETARLTRAASWIDEMASDYGRGLAQPVWEEMMMGKPVKVPAVAGAYGSVQITLWPLYPK